MAAAGPVRAMAMPVQDRNGPTVTHGESAGTSKASFDIALLCSRLESFRREQEAARIQSEKRKALRNGSYVPRRTTTDDSGLWSGYGPRHAAISLAAAATSMKDAMTLTSTRTKKRTPVLLAPVPEPLATEGRVRNPPRLLYAALSIAYDDWNSEISGESSPVLQPSGSYAKPVDEQHIRLPLTPSERQISIIRVRSQRDSISTTDEHAEKPELDEAPAQPLRSQGPLEAEECRGMREEKKKDWMRRRSSKGQTHCVSQESLPQHYNQPVSAPFSPSRPQSRLGPQFRPGPQSRPGPQPRPGPQSRPENSLSAQDMTTQYRPGDAAKRRSMLIMGAPKTEASVPLQRSSSVYCLSGKTEDLRRWKSSNNLGAPIPEHEEPSPRLPDRPQSAAYDRPDESYRSNWNRSSRLFDKTSSPRSETRSRMRTRNRTSVLEYSLLAPCAESNAAVPNTYCGPPNHHMIADAVRMIKAEERSKRRSSILEFFKKL